MTLSPSLRRFTLTSHVTSSVGWIGAVGVFLAHALVGMTSEDPRIVRGVYLVMEPAAWLTLVPLAIASLITGVVMSLGTTWGLFRHYWVVFKLAITVFSTVILLIYMGTFRAMAGAAADPSNALAAVRNASPILHAVFALLLLLAATVLAIYKPLGLTPYGVRKRLEVSGGPRSTVSGTSFRWEPYALAVFVVLFALMVLWHFAGGGLHGLH